MTNLINVLILSAGRRVELVKCFLSSAKRLAISGRVIAADSNILSPALYFADKKYILPNVNSPDYLEELISLCLQEKISVIIPTIDTELEILSLNSKVIFKKTSSLVLVSSPKIINVFGDKLESFHALKNAGFNTPQIIDDVYLETWDFSIPLFLKPRRGSSSIGTYKISNAEELRFYRLRVKEPIIQEYIEGIEYSVDAFVDLDHKPISIVCRERLATRSGEIQKGVIRRNSNVIDCVSRLIKKFEFIGQITVQLIVRNQIPYIIEVNPRFGGGAPMSIYSGADFPEYIYKVVQRIPLMYTDDYRTDDIYLRYDSTLVIKGQ